MTRHILLLLLSLFASSACATTGTLVRINDDAAVGVEELLQAAGSAPVIITGEVHDSVVHHQIQLDIIKALNGSGAAVAIGMEMFRAESQPALDAWVAGTISTDAFREIYRENWHNLPWELYGEIFEYARDNALPILGLNLERSLVRKVARNGFDSLSRKERKGLPSEIACDVDEGYLKLMERVHPPQEANRKSFINFCQAQLLWDKFMAYRITRYLEERRNVAMVVLVGGGHARKQGGIPEQLNRMLPERRVIVLMPDLPEITGGKITPADADYLILEKITGTK